MRLIFPSAKLYYFCQTLHSNQWQVFEFEEELFGFKAQRTFHTCSIEHITQARVHAYRYIG